jgi:uncharacterized protein YdeI (YjbR/CyaY-like superfamily)
MNEKVDWFFEKDTKWKAEYGALRELVLSTGLVEELKWGCPCYTANNSNVVLIHGFKEYCALLFMKGALMDDPANILIQQTENVQAARQIRFINNSDIEKLSGEVIKYINNAIAIEKSGLKVELKKADEYKVPNEFQKVLDEMVDVKLAFENLTPGRQRAYLFHFASAKQATTREVRIEKYIPKILEGKGLED